MLIRQTNHYEILEISPDASPHEVREAYLRLKAAYNRDSVALYTLIPAEDREDILKSVESAYQTLSDLERRKQYDRCHESMTLSTAPVAEPPHPQVTSIDRVPPMESHGSSDDLLNPPSTDFMQSPQISQDSTNWGFAADHESVAKVSSSGFNVGNAPVIPVLNPQINPTGSHQNALHLRLSSDQSSTQPSGNSLGKLPYSLEVQEEIQNQVEWSGAFLKKLRELRNITIEEIADLTKISKTNLNAIEAEDFKKLPAAVFTRGFVLQYGRLLKLPAEPLLGAYMNRFYAQRPDQKLK
jgi:curved DNA-binding protein CbpA